MRTLGIAEFKASFHKLTEPVIVEKYGKPVGTYYPGAPSAVKREEPTTVSITAKPDAYDVRYDTLPVRAVPKPVAKHR